MKLNDVSPQAMSKNSLNGTPCAIHSPSYFNFRDSSFSQFPNLPYFLIGERCSDIALSDVPSPFSERIAHIVEICPKPKMVGVYTRRIVAFVKDLKAKWNWAFCKLPRYAMCSLKFSTVSLKSSVSIFVFERIPNPTRIRLCDMSPKSYTLANFLVRVMAFRRAKKVRMIFDICRLFLADFPAVSASYLRHLKLFLSDVTGAVSSSCRLPTFEKGLP